MLLNLGEKLSFFSTSSSSMDGENNLPSPVDEDPNVITAQVKDPAFEAMEEDSDVFHNFDDSKISEPKKERGKKKNKQKVKLGVSEIYIYS